MGAGLSAFLMWGMQSYGRMILMTSIRLTIQRRFPVPTQVGGATVSVRDMRIDQVTRRAVIDRLAEVIRANYIDPELAESMAREIETQDRAGRFSQITSAVALCDVVNHVLRSVCSDSHLGWMWFSTEEELRTPKADPVAVDQAYRDRAELFQHGLHVVDCLEGNIGYVDLRNFFRKDVSGASVSLAMEMLADTKALIIDLRENQGGDLSMVSYLCSYLLPSVRTPLLEEHYRPPQPVSTWFTEADLPSNRYLDRPVYLLTSRTTWSAAEAFCDVLKHLSRATLVGETTRGGANGTTAFFSLSPHFDISLPICRMINPVTGTNWEGIGVEPHVAVEATVAHRTAIEHARAAI